MRASRSVYLLGLFEERQPRPVPQDPSDDVKYSATTRCPQCGREHITVFRLRHITDRLFMSVGDYFRFKPHYDPAGKNICPNSGQSPKG